MTETLPKPAPAVERPAWERIDYSREALALQVAHEERMRAQVDAEIDAELGFRARPTLGPIELIDGIPIASVTGSGDMAYCTICHRTLDVGGELRDHLASHRARELEPEEIDAIEVES